MGFLDKFLDAIKLNDDYDDEDDFLDDFDDDEFDDLEEGKAKKTKKRRFMNKKDDDFDDDFDFDDDSVSSAKSTKSASDNKTGYKQSAAASSSATYKRTSSKVTPMRKKTNGNMEVNVVRPTKMDDVEQICDTLMSGCTVILNLEGLDVEIAQRIIDFTGGASYALGGKLQQIGGYIYVLTPANVELSGEYQEILSGAKSANFRNVH